MLIGLLLLYLPSDKALCADSDFTHYRTMEHGFHQVFL